MTQGINRRYLTFLIIALALWLIPTSWAFASDISHATYSAIIRISNNSSATQNYVSVNVTIPTQQMMNQGWLNAAATNTAVRTNAGADTSHMPNDPTWMLWVPSIAGNSNLDYVLYTGGTPSMAAPIRYFPGTTGMMISDNASLEGSDNVSLELKGMVDTTAGSNKFLIRKADALQLSVDNVTSGTIRFGPDGIIEPVSANQSAALWSNITNTYDRNTATYAEQTVGGAVWTDYLQLNTHAIVDGVRYYVSSGTSVVQDINIDLFYNNVWNSLYTAGTGYTGAWIEVSASSNITVTAARIRLQGSGPGTLRICEFNFRSNTFLTLTGVSTAEHPVIAAINKPFVGLGVDSTLYLPTASNLVYNGPLRQTELSGSSFYSIDNNQYLTTANATWSSSAGRTFDGTTTVTLTNIWAGLSANTAGTIDIWARLPDATPAANMALVSFGDTNAVEWMSFRVNTSGNVYVDFYDAGAVQWIFTSNNAIFTDNTWVNVTLVQNGISPVLYVNGVLAPITFNSSVNTTRWFSVLGGVDNAFLGKLYMNSADNQIPLTGSIGDARFYSGALTAGQALANYNGSLWKYNGSTTVTGYSYSTITMRDNTSDWYVAQNGAMPYMEYYSHTVGGVLQTYLDWEYGTIFYNSLGTGNNATPSFRTTSSNANVSAVLVSFIPISLAQSTAGMTTDNATMWSENVSSIPNMYTELNYGQLPGSPVVNAIMDAANIPRATFWFPFAFIGIALLGLGVYKLTSKPFIQLIIMAIAMGFFAGTSSAAGFIIPWWVVPIFIIWGWALLEAEASMG